MITVADYTYCMNFFAQVFGPMPDVQSVVDSAVSVFPFVWRTKARNLMHTHPKQPKTISCHNQSDVFCL